MAGYLNVGDSNVTMPGPGPDENTFNVFISYNSEDLPVIREIVETLRQADLRVWIDDDELIPGSPFSEVLAKGLQRSGSAAIFVGLHGYGKYQALEVDAAVNRQLNDGRFRVIPVLLPLVSEVPEKLLGVPRNSWVRFRARVDEHEALRRLRWGITGVKPQGTPLVTPAPPQPPEASRADSPFDEAVSNLGSVLTTVTSKTLTYFVGPDACCPPSTYKLSRDLLMDVKIAEADDKLLPPLDLASSYYSAARRGDDLALLNRLFDLVRRDPRDIPKTHGRLAALLKLLERRPLPRNPNPPRPLIVTTNFDLTMEFALLQAGVSFTRIVQHRSSPRIDVNDYQIELEGGRVVFVAWSDWTDDRGRVHRRGCRVRPPRTRDYYDWLEDQMLVHGHRIVQFPVGQRSEATVNPLAALSLDRPRVPDEIDGESIEPEMPRRLVPWPVLYKYHGSRDLEGSPAVSADQYLEFVRETVLKGHIPNEILTQIKNSPALFLGYSFLDPSFRLLYNTLLHDRIRKPENRLYSLQQAPDTPEAAIERRIEKRLWDKLKAVAQLQFSVETIEASDAEFLQKVHDHVSAALPG